MVSQTVSEFVAESRWEDIPDDVRHATKRSLLNFFGTALEGTHDSAVESALATLREFAGKGEATLGWPGRTGGCPDGGVHQRGGGQRP